MKGKHKTGILFLLVSVGCMTVLFFMMKYPKIISEGAREGIELCAKTIIPTMFPFFIITSFLMRSEAMFYIGSKIDRLSKKLFNVSGNVLIIFLISIFSSFPIGANLVSKTVEEKTLSKSEGARLMTCCVNAGPAFVVGAVGTGMLNSKKAGFILLASLSVSAFAVFAVTKLFIKNDCIKDKNAKSVFNKPDLAFCLVKSVSDSTSSIIGVCGWIIMFSCLKGVMLNKAGVAMMLLEVTLGCRKATEFPLPVMALVIGWGGLCVHCQVFAAVIKTEMGKIRFFFFRMLNGALSAGICSILLHFFPCSVETFAVTTQSLGVGVSTNVTACAGLLMMCAILIVDFEESRKSRN